MIMWREMVPLLHLDYVAFVLRLSVPRNMFFRIYLASRLAP